MELTAALRAFWSARFACHPYDYIARIPYVRHAVRRLPSKYQRRLEARFFTGRAGLVGAIWRAERDERYYAADERDRSRYTRELWGGDAGITWHEEKRAQFETDAAFRDRYLRFREPVVRALDALLKSDARFTTLCEIGTGNGIFAVHLARRFPQICPVIALDLSAAQIAQNRRLYSSDLVDFQSGEVHDWLQHHAMPGSIVVACGTLECLTETELARLFDSLRARIHPVAVALVEPVNIDLSKDHVSQPRGVMTFSHNYPLILEKCGFKVQTLDLMPIDPSVEHYVSVALLAVSQPSA